MGHAGIPCVAFISGIICQQGRRGFLFMADIHKYQQTKLVRLWNGAAMNRLFIVVRSCALTSTPMHPSCRNYSCVPIRNLLWYIRRKDVAEIWQNSVRNCWLRALRMSRDPEALIMTIILHLLWRWNIEGTLHYKFMSKRAQIASYLPCMRGRFK